MDLPDLLTAAAADTFGATDVVLADGLAPGDHLKTMRLLAPLSRLHERVDPFAAPPPEAKKPPAGSDALWASAFTLALSDARRPRSRAGRVCRSAGPPGGAAVAPAAARAPDRAHRRPRNG
ncbi:MAG: hypothetical protein ACRDSZ_11605 [Pseudonocardiaceae bacterium]